MAFAVDEDPWLGTIERFPTILHARASLAYDMSLETLQRAIVQALLGLRKSAQPIKISVADQDGYVQGSTLFEVGIGNKSGFDRLDPKEEMRLLERIDRKGTFPALDIAVNTRYLVEDGRKHNIRRDRYVLRLLFSPDRAELLVHHIQGLRRLQPNQLIRMMISTVNAELVKKGYSEVELETIDST